MGSSTVRLSTNALLFTLIGWLAANSDIFAADPTPAKPLDIQADTYEYDVATGKAVGQGHVTIHYAELTLTCDQLLADSNSKDVVAKGNVLLSSGKLTWHADEVTGNLESRQFNVGTSYAQADKLFMSANSVKYLDNGKAEMTGARLTTCDHTMNPHYCFSSSKVTRAADGTYWATNPVWRLGDVPVFWLPFIYGNPENRDTGFEIQPGYSSDWGAFLLLGKGFQVAPGVTTKFHLDLRSKRGVAVGNETTVKIGDSTTNVKAYGMRDNEAPETSPGYNRRFDTEEDRYRFQLYHRTPIRKDLNLRLNLDKQSDIDMLQDWFPREYKNDPYPASFGNLTWDQDRFALSLSGRPQVNDFDTVVEEAPKLKAEMPRQQIFETPFYYQGETSLADMKMKWREFDLPADDPELEVNEDYDSFRFDTLHMFYRPIDLSDWQFIPRTGFRATYYSHTSKTPISAQDLNKMLIDDDPDSPTYSETARYDSDGGSTLRMAGELGFDLSTKYYRTWQDCRSSRWGIDGLRHVVQPFANYTYNPEPSEEREHLYFFDEIDRLTEQNFVRLGLKQRWETRRSNHIYTLANLENFQDVHFTRPSDEEDSNDTLGDFGNVLKVTPNERLEFRGGLLVDSNDGTVNRANALTSFGDPTVVRTDIGYLYRNDYATHSAYSMGSTLTDIGGDYPFSRIYNDTCNFLTLGFNFPINAKTSGDVRYEFDLTRGSLASQTYTIQRDLHCWMGAFSVRESEGDIAFILSLYLKAFEDFGLRTSY